MSYRDVHQAWASFSAFQTLGDPTTMVSILEMYLEITHANTKSVDLP